MGDLMDIVKSTNENKQNQPGVKVVKKSKKRLLIGIMISAILLSAGIYFGRIIISHMCYDLALEAFENQDYQKVHDMIEHVYIMSDKFEHKYELYRVGTSWNSYQELLEIAKKYEQESKTLPGAYMYRLFHDLRSAIDGVEDIMYVNLPTKNDIKGNPYKAADRYDYILNNNNPYVKVLIQLQDKNFDLLDELFYVSKAEALYIVKIDIRDFSNKVNGLVWEYDNDFDNYLVNRILAISKYEYLIK